MHKITIDKIRTEGEDFYKVIKEFVEDLEKVDGLVGHNISFDLRMVTNNLRKFGINIKDSDSNPIYNLFEKFNIICTKKLSGGKSLENVYKELFGKEIIGAHDALVDVKITLECFIQLDKINKANSILNTNEKLNNYIERNYPYYFKKRKSVTNESSSNKKNLYICINKSKWMILAFQHFMNHEMNGLLV